MNVKSVEKEDGHAMIDIDKAQAEFVVALDNAYEKCRKTIMRPCFRKG